MSRKITFEESLGASDCGLIIDENGNLKGLFIPDGADDDDVPENIIELCCNQFGIDPEEFYGEEDTPMVLH